MSQASGDYVPTDPDDEDNNLEQRMTDLYGTRLHTGLRRRRQRLTIPAKFRDGDSDLAPYDTNSLNSYLNCMHHDLSLQDYAHIYAAIHCGLGTSDQHNVMTSDEVVTTILTQYYVSKGLKISGQDRVNAVMKELRQLHNQMVVKPVKLSTLSPEEKKASLQYLMFLKKNVVVKSRVVVVQTGENNAYT